jgi:regulator of sigma E protease
LRGFGSTLFSQGRLDEAVSGPVGVYQATAGATQQGVVSVIFLMVVLSINLALFNLLPIPALDGGKLVFLFTELLFRRRVIAERVEGALTMAGFFLLITLMVVITVRDIGRLL